MSRMLASSIAGEEVDDRIAALGRYRVRAGCLHLDFDLARVAEQVAIEGWRGDRQQFGLRLCSRHRGSGPRLRR